MTIPTAIPQGGKMYVSFLYDIYKPFFFVLLILALRRWP
jgi:hypothetical protein